MKCWKASDSGTRMGRSIRSGYSVTAFVSLNTLELVFHPHPDFQSADPFSMSSILPINLVVAWLQKVFAIILVHKKQISVSIGDEVRFDHVESFVFERLCEIFQLVEDGPRWVWLAILWNSISIAYCQHILAHWLVVGNSSHERKRWKRNHEKSFALKIVWAGNLVY